VRLPSLLPTHRLVLFAALLSSWIQASPSLKQPGFHTRSPEPEAMQLQARTELANGTEPAQSTTAASGRYCDPSQPQHPKTLLVSHLSHPSATHLNRQGLLGIEQALPRKLGRGLISRGVLTLFHETGRRLDQGRNSGETIRRAALQADTQLVLSGELINTSGPDRNRSLLTAGRDAVVAGLRLPPDWDSRQRQFVLELHLYHGITGQRLWHRTYYTQGVWRADRTPTSGRFQSPAFRQSQYGTQVEALQTEILAELTQVIRCQPLVGWLSNRGPGVQPLLALGQHQGLTVGDELKVYRLRQEPVANRYRHYRVLLSDTGHRVRVLEAQHHQSLVEWLGPGARPGRYLVVTPAAEPGSQAPEVESASDED